jgi:CHAT domain-containing protein/tetratricopeptide (TPR) repeat protein
MPSDNTSEAGARLFRFSLSVVAISLTLLLFTNVGLASVASALNADNEASQLMTSAESLRGKWSAPDLREATQRYLKAASIWTSLSEYSKASLATSKAGDVCLVLSEFGEAVKLYKRATQLGEKGRDRMAQGRAMSQLALVHSYMGDNEHARAYSTRALAILKVAETDSDPTARHAYGAALSNMGEITCAEGYFAKALIQFTDAAKFFTDDPEGQAKVHLFNAYITGSLGDAEKALSEINQSLNLYRAVNNKDGEGLALSALGQFHSFKGNQEQAIQLHRDAINIFRSVGDRLGEAIALNGLGQAYHKLNQTSAALSNYNEALRLYEHIGALDFVAGMTFKLATFHQDVGDHEKALSYYQRCIKLSRAAKKVRNEANALSEIAIVYASQGRHDQAAKQNRRAQVFYKAIGDRRGQATALNKYADYLLRIGEKQEALKTFVEALSLSQEVGDKSILLDTLYGLARAHKALANYEMGYRFIEQAIHISEELRANVGSPDVRVSYFSGVRQYYDLCRDILMELDRVRPGEGFATQAFFISEESRARSLLDLLQESKADLREGATAELLKREREVNGLFRLLAQYEYDLSLSNKPDSTELAGITKQMDELRAEHQDIQAKLRAQNPKQLSVARLELQDLEEIQKALQRADSMLLEYSLGEERSYLWAITSDFVHSYEIASRADIEVAAREFYDSVIARQKFRGKTDEEYQANVAVAEKAYAEKATRLSEMLLGPVARELSTKRLIVVTEGALQYVPFEALPPPGAGPPEMPRFLIETNEIVALPSMSTLMTMRAAHSRPALPGRIVAVIADPVYNQSDERVRNGALSPAVAHAASSSGDPQGPQSLVHVDGPNRLVYAAEEADAISKVAPWGTTMVATGFDANRETATSPRVGEYQIVHFATHGFLDSEHPELSGIVLSMVDENGLQKNGFMPLHDIYNLHLSAELTVLSACQTALGKDIKGEGMVGLTHSFMSAGSKSVVASLWKVDDRATAILMSDFYRSMLQQGVPPVAALRGAKLKMIQDKRWSAPYYWAGFVFQGDFESRINVERDSRFLVGLALLLLVVISSGLIVFLRRR